jgi:hypothetical protein
VREGLFVGWSRSEIAGSEVKTGLPTEVFDCVVYKRDWLVEITLAGLKSMKPCHLDSHFLTVDNGWRRGEIKNVLLDHLESDFIKHAHKLRRLCC